MIELLPFRVSDQGKTDVIALFRVKSRVRLPLVLHQETFRLASS